MSDDVLAVQGVRKSFEAESVPVRAAAASRMTRMRDGPMTGGGTTSVGVNGAATEA